MRRGLLASRRVVNSGFWNNYVATNPVYALTCICSQIYVLLSAKSWYISRFPGILVLIDKSYIHHFRIDSVTPGAARRNWHRSPSRLLNTLAPCASSELGLVTRDNLKDENLWLSYKTMSNKPFVL